MQGDGIPELPGSKIWLAGREGEENQQFCYPGEAVSKMDWGKISFRILDRLMVPGGRCT